MSAHALADARGTLSGLKFNAERMAHKVERCSEEDRHYLWGELAQVWVQLAEAALKCAPTIDESEDGLVTAEVHVYDDAGTNIIHYPADNVVEVLMALSTQPDIKAGCASQVILEIMEGT